MNSRGRAPGGWIAPYLAAAVIGIVAGCVTAPDQKLADGQAGCVTISTMYGAVSQVVTRIDNAPKGANSSGRTKITCGSAVMEVDSNVSAPVPPPLNPGGVR